MNNVIDNDTGMAIPAETQKSIAVMNQVSSGLAVMQDKYATMPDVNTPEGYELAKAERKEIAAVRISVEKAHKAGKAFYWEGGKKIDGMKNDILKTVSSLEDKRKDAIKAIDDEQARIEREAAEEEQARIESIEYKLARIKSLPSDSIELHQVIKAIDGCNSYDVSVFDEFAGAAQEAINGSLIALLSKREALETQAAEAARLEEQRIEQEKQAAELQKQKDEIAAQQKAIDDAKAESARQAQQVQRENELAEQAEADKKAALEQAETKRLADIETAKQEAAQAERDKTAQAEVARLAEEKRIEAEKAAAAHQAAIAPDAIKLQAWIDAAPEMSTEAGNEAVRRIIKGATPLIVKMTESKAA